MPGSPPISTTEAGTSPPPSTRSSSARPVLARGGGSAWPSRPAKVIRPARTLPVLVATARGSPTSSMMVFHSPQASQRPLHFECTAPQDWQTKCELAGRFMRAVVSWEGLPPQLHADRAFAAAMGELVDHGVAAVEQ